jgi:hypothetical protein
MVAIFSTELWANNSKKLLHTYYAQETTCLGVKGQYYKNLQVRFLVCLDQRSGQNKNDEPGHPSAHRAFLDA